SIAPTVESEVPQLRKRRRRSEGVDTHNATSQTRAIGATPSFRDMVFVDFGEKSGITTVIRKRRSSHRIWQGGILCGGAGSPVSREREFVWLDNGPLVDVVKRCRLQSGRLYQLVE